LIRYRRPETRANVGKIFVPPEADTEKQIRRLQSLGYTILDVSPARAEPILATGKTGSGAW
jgi:hypothetical protein